MDLARWCRDAWTLGAKDLRQRLRDRTAIPVAVLLPLLLAALIGSSLGRSEGGVSMRLALVEAGGARAPRSFSAWLRSSAFATSVSLVPAATRGEAEALLADDRADAALLLPPRRGDAAGAAAITVLADGHKTFAARMADALARRFAATEGGSRSPALPAAHLRSPGGNLSMLDFFSASMAVLFLNFAVLAGARALQAEKDAGAFARLAASPAASGAVLAGKFGALLLLGLLQMAVMIAATGALFGTRWGNPLPVAALATTTVLASVGMMCFCVAAAGNADRGYTVAAIAIFLLAVVGGQFLPPQGLPDVFDLLARLTPNGQAFRGFTDLAAAGSRGSVATVAEPLLVTGGVGLAGIAFAARRAQRTLERGA